MWARKAFVVPRVVIIRVVGIFILVLKARSQDRRVNGEFDFPVEQAAQDARIHGPRPFRVPRSKTPWSHGVLG